MNKTKSLYLDSQVSTRYSSFISSIEKPPTEPHNSFSTKAIHSGQGIEQVHGSVNTPIYFSSTFAQKEPGSLYSNYLYSRWGNPTRTAFDDCMAALEHAKHALSFSSGSSALVCVLLTLKTGDHVICCDDVYGGTQCYLREILEKNNNIIVDFVDLLDFDTLEKNDVTLRDRDSMKQVRISIDKLPETISALVDGSVRFAEMG